MTEAFPLVSGEMITRAGLGFALGILLGIGYFQSLWWNVRFLTGGSAWRAVGLHLVRFAVLGVSLYVAARYGAVALIAAALGILVARAFVLRRVRRLR